jgi:holliday junction DNA helicase RuvA
MIRSVRGRLVGLGAEGALVEVGGVGLQLSISTTTLGELPGVGSEVSLQAYLVVREDALDLYGFASADERALFEAFISVNGVGPRIGLALCGLDTPAGLRNAVVTGDSRRLQEATGVGKRTAERIVLELRDRLGDMAAGGSPARPGTRSMPVGPLAEAREGLIALGFAPDEAGRALDDAPPDADTAALVRYGLTRLRRA